MNCIVCNCDVDETEYQFEEDADICDYCFMNKLNEVRARWFLNGKNDKRDAAKLVAILAEVEIRIEKSTDAKLTGVYSKIKRLIEA